MRHTVARCGVTAAPHTTPLVYSDDFVRLHHADCRDFMAGEPACTFDMVFADPWYGETSVEGDRFDASWLSDTHRVLKASGSLWCCGTLRMFLDHGVDFRAAGLAYVQDVIWEKHNGSNSAAGRFKRVHETFVQFRRASTPWAEVYSKPVYTNDATARQVRRKRKPPHWGEIGEHTYESHDGGPRLQRSVIYARSMHGRAIQPFEKPVAIVTPLLRYSCPAGGLVLDPFSGSGAALEAARALGMRAIGTEVDGDRATNAAKRLAARLV